jgi:predicted CXXCH cytochrome family protein
MLFALLLALLAAGATLALAQAQTGELPQPSTGQDESECTVCHTEFGMKWQSGPHGQAGRDPVFLDEWTRQGQPGACLVCHTTGYDPAGGTWESDNITCQNCHGEAPADHPKSPMPVDRSPDLCGRCHSDTRFGWQDWQGSTHYQRGMSCSTCHDPHSAALKLTGPRDGTGYTDGSQLCINCHQEASMNFPYTSHHEKGVACVDCHLNHLEDAQREAHTMADHSFQANLATCNKCHADQMHMPTDALAPEAQGAPIALNAPLLQQSSVVPQPEPVSPLGYATLSALIGLAAGMVLAPWLERLLRRVTRPANPGGDQ